MGLFDAFNPLTLAGAAQGMAAGREAVIARDQADADRAVRQQDATTNLLRARNEALAPFRAEIARQLQIHDAYRPYHQAGLMEQHQTTNAHDPRVVAGMQAFDAALEPYRQALATDNPDEVRRIIQNSLDATGKLPPYVPNPGANPQDTAAHGTEVPQGIKTAGNGMPPIGTPANPRHNKATSPEALAYPKHNSVTPPKPAAEEDDEETPKTGPPPPGDPLHPLTGTGPVVPGGETFAGPPVPPAAPDLTIHGPLGQAYQHALGASNHYQLQPPAAPPGPASVAATPTQAPTKPGVPYDPTHPNPSPVPLPGVHKGAAPYIGQGADGKPLLRVPGVGDVPLVTAQRVLDQANQDPAVISSRKFASHMNLVASLGPGVDPQVLDKANVSAQAAWDGALTRYAELDKLPTDQLNTLMSAYSTKETADTAAAKAPAEIAGLTAAAELAKEQAANLRAKTPAEVSQILANNAEILSRAGMNSANAKKAIADSLKVDADRLNIPQANRLAWYQAHVQAKVADAQRLQANAAWNDSQAKITLDHVRRIDPLLADMYSSVYGGGKAKAGAAGTAPGGGPFNVAKAWAFIDRAGAYEKDPQIRQWRETMLSNLRAATATAQSHPELVLGNPPTDEAWRGGDLWAEGAKVTDYMDENGNYTGEDADDREESRKRLTEMRAWRAWATGMHGTTPGTFLVPPGPKGLFTRMKNGVMVPVDAVKDAVKGPFAGWKATPKTRSGGVNGTAKDDESGDE
jgi:hypothetical protein